MQDLKFALRLLRKHRSFTVAVVATMALAIGACTATFGIVNALFLRPLDIVQPGRLYQLRMYDHSHITFEEFLTNWSYPDFADYRRGLQPYLAGMSLSSGMRLAVVSDGRPRTIHGGRVSANFFQVMGVRPILGRVFDGKVQMPLQPEWNTVISRQFWLAHYRGRRDAIGSTLTLDGHSFNVIGVVDNARLFSALDKPDVWITNGTAAVLHPDTNSVKERGAHWAEAFVRLKPGVSAATVRRALDDITHQLAKEYPHTNKQEYATLGAAGTLYGLMNWGREGVRSIVLALMGVALAILLIACANIANLFLARAAVRTREIAIRMTLGAQWPAVTRQLLTEALVLSILGFAGGLLIGWCGIQWVRHVPAFTSYDVSFDWRVLVFTCLIALGASLLFSLTPLVPLLKADVFNRLRVNMDSLGRHSSRIRDALVVVQVALCLALLAAAGLFIRTLNNAQHTDLGFDPAHILVVEMSFPSLKLTQPPSKAILDRLRSGIKQLPGISSVAFTSIAPLSGSTMTWGVYPVPGGPEASAGASTVDDDYFRTLGVPLLQGSGFTGTPLSQANAIVVNAAFAKQFWPHGWKPGMKVRASDKDYTVVGVVANAHLDSVTKDPGPRIFFRWPTQAWSNVDVIVHTRGPAVAQKAAVARAIHRIAPDAIYTVSAMTESVQEAVAPLIETAAFLTGFAVIALVLAAVGIYALLAYTVAQRTAEVGLRQAVGASYGDIIALFARKSAMLVFGGIALGLAAAVVVMRALRHFLYGVAPSDPATLIGAAAVFVVIATTATFIPARRAARTDPSTALQSE